MDEQMDGLMREAKQNLYYFLFLVTQEKSQMNVVNNFSPLKE